MDALGALLPIVLIGVVVFILVRATRRRRNPDLAAWDEQDQIWYDTQYALVTDPTSDPQQLLEFATDEWPEIPKRRLATLNLYRYLARNPSLAPDIRSGLMSRMGSEEAAIRTDKTMARLEQKMKNSRGGGSFMFYAEG